MNVSEARKRQAEPSVVDDFLPLDFEEEQLPTNRPGDCETCGQWDGELREGMCEWCRQQYGVTGES